MVFALLFVFSAIDADKVIVVPLGSNSKAKRTDGQVQYNEVGETAGAEIY